MASVQNTVGDSSNNEILFRKCFVFVLDIIQYTELLEKREKIYVAKQLLEVSTALGACMNKLKNTNDKDFFNKKIKSNEKKAVEIKYWIQLCKFSPSYPQTNNLVQDIDELIMLFSTYK
ncbi:MAG: four helix bundle protein [Bacteroidota bacterium]|nr:four helix bundle protein [Bacteroidota bacterium]